MRNIQEDAVKIAEQTIGDDICNQIGLKATIKVLEAIEAGIQLGAAQGIDFASKFDVTDDKENPVQPMKMNLQSL